MGGGPGVDLRCAGALPNSITERKRAAGGSRLASSSSGACVLEVESRVFRNTFWSPGRRTSVLPPPEGVRPTFDRPGPRSQDDRQAGHPARKRPRASRLPPPPSLDAAVSAAPRPTRKRTIARYRIRAPKALAASSTASAAVAFSRSRMGLTSTISNEPSRPDSATSSIARCASR